MPTEHVPDHEDRQVAREFLAAALYMALVQWAALVAIPAEHIPDSATVVQLLLGTGIGLILAHWLAFRLASHLAEGGLAAGAVAREAGAQVGGGLMVAVIASVPFLLLEPEAALRVSVVVLGALPALTGFAIARLRGRSLTASLVVGAVVLGIAMAVVVVKSAVGH